MKNRYMTPTLTVQIIYSDNGLATSSVSFQTGDDTASMPDITSWNIQQDSYDIEL